ncbi:endonuclease V [Candidatus Woesearchaeota archaeon]|nr:endonuclease V [Candidatus Woesearchaeota archaeon]
MGEQFDLVELKREQERLNRKLIIEDQLPESITKVGAATTISLPNKLLAIIVVCEFPSMNVLEEKTYTLHNPLPPKAEFLAYREMPAIIEAYNQLEQEPDLLLVKGYGILHPRNIGVASHLGLVLNIPTLGVADYLALGTIEQDDLILNGQLCGHTLFPREHSNLLYITPGHKISFDTARDIAKKCIQYPHKMPEPLHIALRLAKKKMNELSSTLVGQQPFSNN